MMGCLMFEITDAVKTGEWGEVIWDFTDLEWFLRHRYHCKIIDIEITETPGYWQMKKPCQGKGHCKHPIHQTLFNESGMQHSIKYIDEPRG